MIFLQSTNYAGTLEIMQKGCLFSATFGNSRFRKLGIVLELGNVGVNDQTEENIDVENIEKLQ